MNKREYAEQVAKAIGNGDVVEVEKANSTVRTGIQFDLDDKVKPVFYIDDLYDDDCDVDEAVKVIQLKLGDKQVADIQMVKEAIRDISDFGSIKPLLRIRLYNGRSKFDVAQNGEKWGFDDLILVPYINISDSMSARVQESMLKMWLKTADEVIDIAIENSKDDVEIKNMAEFMREFGMDDAEDGPMWVISNKSRAYGASAVLFAKEKLESLMPNGYVILPSSIHEVIAMDKSQIAEDENIDSLIQEVNDTQVMVEEQLSDHAYVF